MQLKRCSFVARERQAQEVESRRKEEEERVRQRELERGEMGKLEAAGRDALADVYSAIQESEAVIGDIGDRVTVITELLERGVASVREDKVCVCMCLRARAKRCVCVCVCVCVRACARAR